MLHLLWEEFGWVARVEIEDLLTCVVYLKGLSFHSVKLTPQTDSKMQGRVEAVPRKTPTGISDLETFV